MEKTWKQTDDFGSLESYLQTALTPISPRPDFVRELRAKLDFNTHDSRDSTSIFQYTLLVLAVGLGGILLMISLVRGMVALMRAISNFRGKRFELVTKSTAP